MPYLTMLSGKVIMDTHLESDHHQNLTTSRGSPLVCAYQIWFRLGPCWGSLQRSSRPPSWI